MNVVKGKILIEPASKSEETFKDFVVPENENKVDLDRGTAISVGRGVKDVKEGDVVVFNAYARGEFELKGKKYFVVSEEDIIVILNNK